MKMKKKNNKIPVIAGLIFAAGAAAGYIAGLFTPDKVNRKNKQILLEKIDAIKAYFTDKKRQEKIRSIIKDKKKEAKAFVEEIEDYIARGLASIQESIGSIDKKRYIKAVENAFQDVKKKHSLSSAQFERLKKYFIEDWQNFSQNFQQSEKT